MRRQIWRLLFLRRGDIYAWTATILAVVALPLSSLAIDVVRMMYVRGHLQTASDAACQAAADAVDVSAFISSGTQRIDRARANKQAGVVFQATLSDSGRVGYGYQLAVSYHSPTIVHCTASATVEHIVSITPPMNVVVETTSEMRIIKQR